MTGLQLGLTDQTEQITNVSQVSTVDQLMFGVSRLSTLSTGRSRVHHVVSSHRFLHSHQPDLPQRRDRQ